MNEPSDGIAEELERQLQLALAAAAIVARRATAARQHQLEQAQRSAQNANAVKAQIDAERRLAAAHVQPVFDTGWWDTAAPGDVTAMWQQANSWRDPDRDPATPTVFDHAATRIGQEVSDRAGLDPTQILALATLQELEHEDQTASADPARQPVQTEAAERDVPASGGFDDPQRRDQLREQLVAAGVPEAAIEARTLADVGQGREPAEGSGEAALLAVRWVMKKKRPRGTSPAGVRGARRGPIAPRRCYWNPEVAAIAMQRHGQGWQAFPNVTDGQETCELALTLTQSDLAGAPVSACRTTDGRSASRCTSPSVRPRCARRWLVSHVSSHTR